MGWGESNLFTSILTQIRHGPTNLENRSINEDRDRPPSPVKCDIFSIPFLKKWNFKLDTLSVLSRFWYPVSFYPFLKPCRFFPVSDTLSVFSRSWYPVSLFPVLIPCQFFPVSDTLSVLSCYWYTSQFSPVPDTLCKHIYYADKTPNPIFN